MPTYDYECSSCGLFSVFRSMADYAQPAGCALCGAQSPRAYVTAPAFANMDAGIRRGAAVNERARHEPLRSSGAHPSGCGCCSGKRLRTTASPAAAKSFPGARPWMISH